jgi:peptidoglycan/LPS O-acetylase OafA/YrhL
MRRFLANAAMVVGLIAALLGAFVLAREKTVHVNGIPVTDAKGPAVAFVALGTLLIVYGARARRRTRSEERDEVR